MIELEGYLDILIIISKSLVVLVPEQFDEVSQVTMCQSVSKRCS
jgi:hypothetical protein